MDVPVLLQRVLDIHQEVEDKLENAEAETASLKAQLSESTHRNSVIRGQVAALTLALTQEKDRTFTVQRQLKKELRTIAFLQKNLATMTTALDQERKKASTVQQGNEPPPVSAFQSRCEREEPARNHTRKPPKRKHREIGSSYQMKGAKNRNDV